MDGGSPKSAAEDGSGAERDGGRVGGLEDCLELEPEPLRSGIVEYGAAESRASRIMEGADVTSDCAWRMIVGVPTWATVENWLLSGCTTVAAVEGLLKLWIGLPGVEPA